MRDLLGKTFGRSGKLSIGFFLISVALCVYGIWLLSADARRELDTLATAGGDRLQWSLTQSEVGYLRLRNAALLAKADDPVSLQRVRREFDVFYSQMNIIGGASAFGRIRDDPKVSQSIGRIFAFMADYVPVIDSDNAVLGDAMPTLREALEPLHDDIRAVSLVGVRVFAALSETQRERVADALFDLAMLILFLGVLLLGVVFILAHVLSISWRQTAVIERAQGRLESIVGTSLDGVVVVDSEGRVIEFNGAAEKIFGYDRDEALGRTMSDLIMPPQPAAANVGGMYRYLTTDGEQTLDGGLVQLVAVRKDGTEFPVELSISTAQSEEGEIFISFVRDISTRVASEKELVEALDRAVTGEKAKADLLAVMSHEMRTPLNGILGTLDLLQSTGLDERQRRLAGVMGRSGQMLLRHVNDVLDVSRMDAEASVALHEPFDPGALAHSVGEGLRSAAAATGNTVEVNVLGPVPPLVLGDRDRLEQVLVNLVGNAAKFTENGRISIEVEAVPGSDFLELRVIDTGIGIAERDMGRIFDDFVTLDASYARSAAGTGLGLGITRRLMAILGGEIGVESEVGQGSVFWVRVPLPAVDGAEPCPAEEPMQVPRDGRGRRVLLVEDNEINRLVAREMLNEIGYKVVEARDGVEGVECATKERFDFIAMDINMPRLDGVSVAINIRGGDGPNKATPIIALTAHALPEDIRRFRAAGFTDVLVKPLSRRSLAAALSGTESATLPATPESSGDEVQAVLGKTSAARLRGRAFAEISDTLDDLATSAKAGALNAASGDALHRIVGLAGLIGMTEVHAGLIALEGLVRSDAVLEIEDHIGAIRLALSAAQAAT